MRRQVRVFIGGGMAALAAIAINSGAAERQSAAAQDSDAHSGVQAVASHPLSLRSLSRALPRACLLGQSDCAQQAPAARACLIGTRSCGTVGRLVAIDQPGELAVKAR